VRLRGLRIHTRISRIVVAAVFALGFALPLSAVLPASAAHAATMASVSCAPYQSGGDWFVNQGCDAQEIPGSHHCAVMGEVDGIQAIQCADIWVSNNDASGFGAIYGEGSFYCQDSAGYYPCAGMNVNVGGAYAEVIGGLVGYGYQLPVANFKCNPSGLTCYAGRQYQNTGEGVVSNTQCWQTYMWDPTGNVIQIVPGTTAIHSSAEVDSNTVTVCLYN